VSPPASARYPGCAARGCDKTQRRLICSAAITTRLTIAAPNLSPSWRFAAAKLRNFSSPLGDDGYGNTTDLKMVRGYLQPSTELEFIAEVARLRAAAHRLVTAERAKIEIVAAALLRHGTLSGEEVVGLAVCR
jgi:hypothetical protein